MMAAKVLNGQANCVLEVCCLQSNGQPHPKAVASLAQMFKDGTDCGLSDEAAAECAAFVYANFDLAERGTLQAFKASIARVYDHR